MECRRCGLPLLGTELFCPQCGAKIDHEQPTQAVQPETEPESIDVIDVPLEAAPSEPEPAAPEPEPEAAPEEPPVIDASNLPVQAAPPPAELSTPRQATQAPRPRAPQQPAQRPAQQPVQRPAPQPAQRPAPQPAQAPAQQPVQRPTQPPAQAPAQRTTTQAAQVPVQRAPRLSEATPTVQPSAAAPAYAGASAPTAGAAPAASRQARWRAALVGPLGLGVLAGCLFLFILGLGAIGVYQGQRIRSERQQQEAVVHYERGLDYLQSNEYDLAAAEFEYALRLRPNYLEAQQKLAEARAQTSPEQPTSAPSSGEDSSSLLNDGRAAYDSGDWDTAISKLEQLQILDSNYEQTTVRRLLADSYSNSGLKLVNDGRMEEAIRRFDQALTIEPDNTDYQLQSNLATQYQAGITNWGVNWQTCIQSLAAVYALKPDYLDIGERLQQAYVQAGDAAGQNSAWCNAVEYYKMALDLSQSQEVANKRDDAAHRCASSPTETSGTPVPTGTFVGVYQGMVDISDRTKDWCEVRGRVTDADGNPVSHAEVRISAFDWTSDGHTTDDNGYYSIQFLNNEVTFTVTLVGPPAQSVDVPTKFGFASVADFQERN